ncbi:MAG: M20/M25/M40 family metallo-hydrolase [Sphingobium sp.]
MPATPQTMHKIGLTPLALPFLLLAATANAQSPAVDVAALRDAALKDDIAMDIVEGLTTEVGPRPAATEREAKARDWAVVKLKALGFSNVRIEPYTMPAWVRGEETATLVSTFPQSLTITALGNSGTTGKKGLTAEVVYFPTLADLQAAPDGRLKGKIAFVSHAMKATQDGSSYGAFGAARFAGPGIAAQKGAAAILIKSIGTDNHRVPHTGVTRFPEGVTPIPAAALSVPDADQLERVFKRGKPVTLSLLLTPRFNGTQQSGNVIAEVPGSDPDAGIIMVTGHLDSWDLGTGAIDDASGVAIVTAAAKRIMDAGTPRRTIRILLAGAEEVGSYGGNAYYEAHKSEPHVLTSESDFGADRIWRVDFAFPTAAKPVATRIASALAPLGISAGAQRAGGGADNAKFADAGIATIDLQQDGTRYFDLHHTADDTLDKIDPQQLRQNVAAWTTVLAIAANAQESLR